MVTRRSARAAHALAHMPEIDPTLAALALWCEMQDGAVDRTYISGDVIHVGAAFPGLPLREQIGLLGHHILHIALRHEYRMQTMRDRFGASFDAGLHNLCSDAVLNECLVRGGHAIPRPSVLLRDLCDLAETEAIDPTVDILSQWDVDKLYFRLKHAPASTVDGLAAYSDEVDFSRDVFMQDATLKTDRNAGDWRAHLIRAAQGAGAAGRGVGKHLRHLADISVSRTPWEHHLRRLLAKAVSQDPRRSYRRPRSKWIAADAEARRYNGPTPVFEPAEMRNTLRPRLVIGLDASSSVSTDVLSMFAAEIIGITQKSNAETHVLVFDDEVFAHRKIEAPNARAAFENMPFRRDGGTSFIDVLDKADALAPSLVVIMTDLAGSFGRQPSAPVLWAATAATDTRPPFGQVLELER